ncbi:MULTISPECIES: alanine--tRNA ligase [unclassified Lentimicrobium]|uniref:alanine--tRNA ligase n=1 Tax=unclassified Lentimicrobium TaxID=2677434 RepID=UPI001551DF4C|nr:MULTISPECIES: alanine--tRNA ligase [unclassified Lentimicrobium]NPD45016.1 alanine--tRNA ligase [Lentimicrobium sp. S6]NPD86038.1 alanine--tRNA ligase [Lentimicrobium sp. L6]
MKAAEIRRNFIEFFESKQHSIVPSSPMVMKNDPTLMFVNAGMNQFKDVFLGHGKSVSSRVANSQKCLRVSGKHNDLEEVGHDTYHHTMFEMLGNWSFGDYFKEEAISWAWELLTELLKLDKDRLYVTVFEGDEADGTELDTEALEFWKKFVPAERILNGNKKDNFWEMGDSGPCGPCSEIHIDLRSDEERAKISGDKLVNEDHPQVVEIWNLVFIQYNRKASGQLENLPAKHIDTGMGFERLTMAIQGKRSNYDTDIFQPLLQEIANMCGKDYGQNEEHDIAMRVIADHLRAIAFAIADGQLPSNTGAGYVIRRILRRAVRYGYSFLGFKDAFIYKLVDILVSEMGDFFPELAKQKQLIEKVMMEEENSFLRTLSTGIQMLDKIIDNVTMQGYKVIKGQEAFELYDTFGFPFDLTELILKEKGLVVSKREFDEEMEAQKQRSKKAATSETDDWVVLKEDDVEEFIGYDHLQSTIHITKYRKVITKNKELFQLAFNITPFYAEAGGQVGDTGYIESETEKISIIDTKKENNLIIHIAKQLPKNPKLPFKAVVSSSKRAAITKNHTATHLMHKALREILGTHVEQKGSLVNDSHLRFDFSHFQRMEKEEIAKVEALVNVAIQANTAADINGQVPIEEAEEKGAMMLFGEKYGDLVRVVKFGDSVELCGGTHVEATGQIGLFKIIHESAIASGVRRIEAYTGQKAFDYMNSHVETVDAVKGLLKNQKDVVKGIQMILDDQKKMQKQVEELLNEKAQNEKKELENKIEEFGEVKWLGQVLDLDAGSVKNLAFQLTKKYPELILAFGNRQGGKASLTIALGEHALEKSGLKAGQMIRTAAQHIQGGGGGQDHFATAGGKNPEGLDKAVSEVKAMVKG